MNIRPKNKYIPICNVKKKRKTTNPWLIYRSRKI
jgi:hypothetical protein